MSLTIRLSSIKCIEEINENSSSEEPYVLVVSIDISTFMPNFDVFCYGIWEDCDKNEVKVNHGRRFWGLDDEPKDIKNIDDVIFIIILMENDNGSPAQVRSMIKLTVAASIASSIGETNRSKKVKRLLEDIKFTINALDPPPIPFYMDDDHIGTKELRLDSSDLTVSDKKYKSLIIKSDEGHYELTFLIRRGDDPPPTPIKDPPPPPGGHPW